MTETQTAKLSLLRCIWKTIDEFAPPPTPRPTPSYKEFADGREAVGIIRYARPLESPEGGLMDDELFIHIDTSLDGQPLTLPRTVMCPLLGAGAGRKLIGAEVVVRHTTFDPDYDNDILVTRWPRDVTEVLKPIRYQGPGAVRAHLWGVLARCFFIIGYAGVLLTPLLLAVLLFGLLAGTDVLAEFLPGLHPAIAVLISIGMIPAGLLSSSVCESHRDALLARNKTVGER